MIRFKKIEGDIKERLPHLVNEFKKDARINALYIFGSYAQGEPKPLSDVDVAILLKKNSHSSKYWDIRLDLLTKATQILKTDEIDLVVLNEAPYDLAYNVLKNGKILFCHNESERAIFQEKTVSNYLDTKALREEIYFHLVERLKNGRFGCDKGKYKEAIENVRRIFREVRRNSKNS